MRMKELAVYRETHRGGDHAKRDIRRMPHQGTSIQSVGRFRDCYFVNSNPSLPRANS